MNYTLSKDYYWFESNICLHWRINGTEYKSIKFESESLGITGRMVITRLNSKKTEYINWIRL